MLRTSLLATVVAGVLVAGQAAAFAGKPSGGGSTGCGTAAPTASIANNYQWGKSGVWGTPGQKINIATDVMNNQGCSASMTVTLSAPAGWTVSAPTAVTVPATSDAYAWGSITSPANAVAGTYTITATVTTANGLRATAQSVYMVYTSDTTPPQIYWTSPAAGSDVTGRSTAVGFGSTDDHQLSRISVAIDGTQVATVDCSNNVSYDCLISYTWSIRGVSGQHTATFTSTDHVGNLATMTVAFRVN